MQVNRYHILVFLLLFCASCIEPFQPVIDEIQESITILGAITDQAGIHQVTVSISTPYNNPSFVPLSGCVVRVEDNLGDMVVYAETQPGIYEAYLNESFLAVNRLYSLFVNTMNGDEYQSSYDTLLACPSIDTIYFELDSVGTSDPNVTHYGLQFYSELTSSNETSRNFRWKLEETWEYRSADYATHIWYGGPLITVMEDTMNTCYMSDVIFGLYSASTRNLTENRLVHNKLNYVSNETPRLDRQYSLLVKQQSLSNEMFSYWERMKSQSGDGGGLYETQPSSTIGNIYNINNPEEKVLGCFYATQQQSKRFTFKADFNFRVPVFTCELDTVNRLDELGELFPYFLRSIDPMGMGGPPYLFGSPDCFYCVLKGGTNVKPEYW